MRAQVGRLAGPVAAYAALLMPGAAPAAASPQPLGLAQVRVSLSAPVAVQRGQAADLGAVVSAPATGDRVSGVTVILFGRPAKGGPWTEADRTVTNHRGVAAFRVAPRVTTDFAAEALQGAGFAGGVSGVVRVKVRR